MQILTNPKALQTMTTKVLLNGQKPKDPETLLEYPNDLIQELQKTWPSIKLAELNWHDFDSVVDHKDWHTCSYSIMVLNIKHKESNLNLKELHDAIQSWINDQDDSIGAFNAVLPLFANPRIDILIYFPL